MADKDDFGGTECEYNREHVFARSNADPEMGSASNSSTGIIADPHNLTLKTWVDGELRQSSNTQHLVFNCYEMIAYLSLAMTLEPGDVISTGTPSGVGVSMKPRGYMKAGQQVKIEIEKILSKKHNNDITKKLISLTDLYGDESILKNLNKLLQSSLLKIRKRLGLMLYNEISIKIQNILIHSCKISHEEWIKELLVNYYDPMYDYQLEIKKDRCLLKSNKSEVIKFLSQIEDNQSL